MEQAKLFTEEKQVNSLPVIGGLGYIRNFVSSAEEADLVKMIDHQSWRSDLKRRVQHYGYRYDYKARSVTADARLGDIPDWLQYYTERLVAESIFSQAPDQVIVNEYQPGQGISPHIDCIPCFGDTIASLSLISPCIMEFSHPETAAKHSMLLEPGSLLILTGEARYQWRHGIAGRKTDRWNRELLSRSRRISLTFRKVIAPQSPAVI